MNQYTASITIVKWTPEPKKTAFGAVKAAFEDKKYQVEIYQNGTSLISLYAKDEAEALAETKNMIASLKLIDPKKLDAEICEALAKDVVNGLDMECLLDYAISYLSAHFLENKQEAIKAMEEKELTIEDLSNAILK